MGLHMQEYKSLCAAVTIAPPLNPENFIFKYTFWLRKVTCGDDARISFMWWPKNPVILRWPLFVVRPRFNSMSMNCTCNITSLCVQRLGLRFVQPSLTSGQTQRQINPQNLTSLYKEVSQPSWKLNKLRSKIFGPNSYWTLMKIAGASPKGHMVLRLCL